MPPAPFYRQLLNESNTLVKIFLSTCLFVLLATVCTTGQELDATVRVIAPNLGLSDKSIVSQLERNVKDFLNNQQWTQDVYEPEEKIKCNFQIVISADRGDNNLLVDLSVQSSRPVYHSNYDSPVLNISDKGIPVQFDPYKNLENSRETYYDNLSAVLTFYAYLIIALDYDSYSLEGGETYLQLLNTMLNGLPSNVRASDDAWSPASDKRNNRYFIIENLTNPRMKLFRRAFYEYHRQGLDLFAENAERARATLTSAIGDIGTSNANYPDTYFIKIFGFTKQQEIIEIYKQGTPEEKKQVREIMTRLDPANSSQYNNQLKS
ncbi:MAG: hypothetical protein JPMHGGIA_02075 [Saprospiraceae bacterium]|jgi:hypothetical protein|nr:hypothetical protein [Saprospiraceae bacterium]